MLRAGDSVGRYLIERRLGHGGMGTLYLAHDPVLDRNIALKLLLGDIDLPGARERFVREARAAAALSNPNIVTIYDYGDYASQPYIVMEYIHGETLAELIRRRPDLPVSVRLRWIEELCSAVGYAHARGIIHRDIKPPNLMIDAYGQLKVLDFGIARMRGTLVTNATALIGTPGYTAPEQIRGGQIDHRSDLFSIGVVCYELLAYAEAFSGDTVHVITNKILNEDPPPLSRLCSVDSELEAVVMTALQKPADARFANTDALRQALADVRVRLEANSDTTTMRYVSPVGAISPRRATTPAPPQQARPATDRGGRSPATPPPDPRRTDRENAARLRVAQIQEHLREARKHLDAGNLQLALASCAHALKLDDSHPEARALLAEVDASREHAVTEWIAEARERLTRGDAVVVTELLDRVNTLGPEHPDVPVLVRDLRLLRADQERARRRSNTFTLAIEAGEAALARADFDDALTHAREALDIDPTSERAQRLQAQALQISDSTHVRPAPGSPRRPGPMTPDDPEPTVVRPRRETSRPAPPQPPKKTTEARPRVVPNPPTLAPKWASLSGRQRGAIGGAATVIVVAAVIGTGLLLRTPPTPSLVVLDATPWATITSIQNAEGEPQPLPEMRSTPLPVQLAPGGYTVSFEGPPPQSEKRTVEIRVESGVSLTVPLQKFAAPSVDEYFRPYLMPPVPATEPGAPVEEGLQ